MNDAKRIEWEMAHEARREGCGACVWFNPVRGVGGMKREKVYGDCQVSPPRTSSVNMWPVVEARLWCSAWTPMRQEAPKREKHPGPAVGEPGYSGRPGELNPRARLTADDVRAIRRETRKAGTSRSALAARYGVSIAQISRVVHGSRWKHVPMEEG